MHTRHASFLAAFSLAIGAFVLAAPRPAVAAPARATTIFKPILPALHRTGVPALLPTLAGLNRYHASIVTARKGQYDVMLGYVPNCGGNACEYGELTADRLTGPRRTIGRAVALPGGLTGYYLGFTCGASCGNSTVRVDVRGYRYIYGLKAGSKRAVVALAASAVRAGPQ